MASDGSGGGGFVFGMLTGMIFGLLFLVFCDRPREVHTELIKEKAKAGEGEPI